MEHPGDRAACGVGPTGPVPAVDVLGRSVQVEAAVEALVAMGTLEDPTFETGGDVSGVTATVDWVVRDGALHLNTQAINGTFDALIALPDPGQATTLHAPLTPSEGCTAIRLGVVDADGRAERDYLEPGDKPAAFALPEGRPLWFAVRAIAAPLEPQMAPPAPCTLTLEELTFVP